MIAGEPWAIRPEILQSMLSTEQAAFKITAPQAPSMFIREGIAVIPVAGILAKNPDIFARLFGAMAYGDLIANLAMATNDPEVKAILLHIDSPGGGVDGVMSAVAAVRAANAKKPVTALADGCCASAAYWLGSAASAIYAADQTTMVGSIGVVAQHIDRSGRDAANGVKVTEIFAGRYKVAASQHRPLDTEGRDNLQERVDYLYGLFVRDVAQGRGWSESRALKAAEGRVYIGDQAVKAGLLDGILTKDELMNQMMTGRAQPRQTTNAEGRVITSATTPMRGAELAELAKRYSALHNMPMQQALIAVNKLFAPVARGFGITPEDAAKLEGLRQQAFKRGCTVADILNNGQE